MNLLWPLPLGLRLAAFAMGSLVGLGLFDMLNSFLVGLVFVLVGFSLRSAVVYFTGAGAVAAALTAKYAGYSFEGSWPVLVGLILVGFGLGTWQLYRKRWVEDKGG